MPIDNDVYDRLGESWWDETSPLNLLHGSVTPGRFAYFRDVLTRQPGAEPVGLRALDIGCGGGFVAEEFAALGCRVTGVDPSPVSIGAVVADRVHAMTRAPRRGQSRVGCQAGALGVNSGMVSAVMLRGVPAGSVRRRA